MSMEESPPSDRIRVEIVGDIPIVPSLEDSEKLYGDFYGKPAGTAKPRPGEVSSPLLLDPVELVYLAESNTVDVYMDSRKLEWDELWRWALNKLPRLPLLYPIYRDLRRKGFVVRSGLKFGADFTVYRRGPGLEHSLFVVHVLPFDERRDPVELVKAGRLSHSVNKTFVLASVEGGERPIYLMLKWFKP